LPIWSMRIDRQKYITWNFQSNSKGQSSQITSHFNMKQKPNISETYSVLETVEFSLHLTRLVAWEDSSVHLYY
jgi:hypothetical protein